MGEAHEELLNLYDAAGNVMDARPRREAKASGLAVGAVNALLINADGLVLLQRRPADKENGSLWDKSVGGHVSAGEDFDTTVVREAGEELFDDGHDARVYLAHDEAEYEARLRTVDLKANVLLRRRELRLNIRDVRHAPGRAGVRNVIYHVAIYLGRTDIPREGFRPQPSEVVDLRYVPAAGVDELLLRGELSPNMAFLWLAQGRALLALIGR